MKTGVNTMAESMAGMRRTHYCAEVTETLAGQPVTVMGWVSKRRDLGGLIFITLRDRSGLVQALADGEDPKLFQQAQGLRGEYVAAITGKVRLRAPENINPDMATGRVEIVAEALRVLSEAETPPFSVQDEGVALDLRLKYRYLDLRRPALQRNLITRHNIAQAARQFLNQAGFYEVETPCLIKTTPEGARDYLVPSRVHPGNFYALPQSPQIFKQLLMLGGLDKYYQIARCFRDEDLRADRQPEFTQIDMELSFVTAEDIMDLNEGLMAAIFREVLGQEIPRPFLRLPYREALARYGSDKPDLRFGLELADLSPQAAGCGFNAFQEALAAGGSVRALRLPGQAQMPRREQDALGELAKANKAKGLAWVAVLEGGAYKSGLSKFIAQETLGAMAAACGAAPGDMLALCADADAVVLEALGAVRAEMGKRLGLIPEGAYQFLWVTEFPLLEWSPEDQRFYAKHHPFTAPMEEDLPLLDTHPGQARAIAYDLVLNGTELGGGSIRIHRREVQQKMFDLLGFTPEEAQERFGFLLDAYRYGAPPHGGVAYGLDRIAMLLTRSESLREVIAFPKVKDASCPLSGAPSALDSQQVEALRQWLK
jgi:aspartyl-tRNA synthetase